MRDAGWRAPAARQRPPAATAAAPVADPNAPPYELRDPAAPALLAGTVHDIDFPIIDKDITVAKGFVVHAWTFGGTVPGPTIRVHLGDTINVHLTNKGQMSHSIDFHASQTAMNHQMVEIAAGETFTYTFTADYAGVWMYHCGTAPTLHHIANGMFGMVIVEPKGGLPKVDQEFAFVQSEWYLGAQKEPADYAKANQRRRAPDFVVFNGIANQYKDNPITVTTEGPGPRVRPRCRPQHRTARSTWSGTIFDTVEKEGVLLKRATTAAGARQAVDLVPRAGRDHRVQPPGGRHVRLRHPRVQLRGPRRHRGLHGRRRRPEQLTLPVGPLGRRPSRVAPPAAHGRLVPRRRPFPRTVAGRARQRRSASGISGSGPLHIETSSVWRPPEVVEEVGAVPLHDRLRGRASPGRSGTWTAMTARPSAIARS